MFLIYFAGIVGVLGGPTSAACPDADTALSSFAAAFPSLTKSSTPDVTTSLLLDTYLDVTTLTISGNGILVFKQQDLVIKTTGILIKDNGKLIIGSEDCRFTNNVDILLEGEERETDRSILTGAGEKYIAVQDKGTLAIWGEEKKSYTKLTQTVKRFDDPSNSGDVIFHHKNSDNSAITTGHQGLVMYVFDSSLVQKSFKVYDLAKNSVLNEQRQVDALAIALDDVAEGDMVMLAVQNYFNSREGTDYTALFTKIETMAGMSTNDLYLRTIHTDRFHYDAWAMVFEKIATGGTPNFDQAYDEQIGKLDTQAIASLYTSGKKASASSAIYRGSTSKSWVDFRILNLALGNPTLNVLDDISSSWSVGDIVLVTTTDYAAHHGEVRTIKALTANTITLNDELSYNHFGAIEDGTDMRAEIALLSRSIKIHGEMFRNCHDSLEGQCSNTNFYTYGAHIKIIHDFEYIHLEYFELFYVGQATDKDNSAITTGHQGLVMYVFDSSLVQKSFKVYDLAKNSVLNEQRQVDALAIALDDVAEGDMVMLAVQNYFNSREGTDYTALFTKIETMAGMSTNDLYLRTIHTDRFHYDAWAMVFEKIATGGTPNFDQAYDEQIGKLDTQAIASLYTSGKKASASSAIYRGSTSKSWVDFRILNLALGNPTLNVLDDISSSWSVGDIVLVTTTDYAAHHGEVRTIKALTANTITLNDELSYNHFGAIEDGTDMRAEIALLSRSIKIHGEMFRNCHDSLEGQCSNTNFYTYGAHIKIIHDFEYIHLEYFELFYVGQATDKGIYPIHFHMCGDVNNREATVKGVSIHHSFSRAITVHGTYGTGAENDNENRGVQLIDNVAYNIYGHCYFLEDGAEPGTYLINNLAAYARNIKNTFNFATDISKVTAFWITNPKVHLVNNVVAGSEGFCYWYTFPLEPVGPGKDLNVFQKNEARNTPLWTFDNNVAHSCKRGCFNFDNILTNDNGAVGGCMNYKSVENPLDPKNSEPVKNIIRMTAYKCLMINIWARGGFFDFVMTSSAHSKRGLQFARGSDQQMSLRMSSVRGTGGANAEPAGYPDAPTLSELPHTLGFVFYDGPSYASDSFFTGFDDTYISAGAFGFNPKNKFTSSVASSIKGIVFGDDDTETGSFNRVFDGSVNDPVNGFGNFNGDESATARDYDGSVTKCPADSWSGPKQIVKPEKFVVTPDCQYRANWQMAICDDLYGKFGVSIKDPSGFNAAAEMRRTKTSDGSEAFEDHTGDHTTQFMVMLKNDDRGYKYDFQFTQAFPTKVVFEAKAVERDYPMTVGICLPVGVTRSDFTLSAKKADATFWSDDSVLEVDSITDLEESDSGRAVFIDGRILYYKYVSGVRRIPEWDAYDTDHCAGGWCPSLTLTLTKTGVVYDSTTKCFNPEAAQLSTDFDISGLSNHTCDLPAGTRPANWGRGDTRSDVDGGWGPWGKWEEKCYTDVNNKPDCSRKRLCDSPPKFGDGADCSGDPTETAECQTQCPVDGVWEQWSQWANCACSGTTSMGTRTRSRTCTGPFHYGEPCTGAHEEENKCEGYCNVT